MSHQPQAELSIFDKAILNRLGRGDSAAEVAGVLDMSVLDVIRRVVQLRALLGAATNAEAAFIARRDGLM